MGKKGRTRAGRGTGVSSCTGRVRGESGSGPHSHGLWRSLSLSTGLCSVESSEGFTQHRSGNKCLFSGRKIIMRCIQKTKTIILSAPDACTTRLGPARPGSPVRERCSSHPVSTQAMIHRFPVETETLEQSLNGGELPPPLPASASRRK